VIDLSEIDPNAEPLLISGIRNHPTGEIRHIPGGGIGMGGCPAATFLAEYDAALEAAYRLGWRDACALDEQTTP